MPPILYTFRRCPYAIRARMALSYSSITVELREVKLRDMPSCMLKISPKATVPVLQLPDGAVIDESWDIIQWALRARDPAAWLGTDDCHLPAANELISINDYSFKPCLDRYKYADKHPEHPAEFYRRQAEEFLQPLEARLNTTQYLLGDEISVADIGLFPFIRQFSLVDKDWFEQSTWSSLQDWLNKLNNGALFDSVMGKTPTWNPGDKPILFSGGSLNS